MKGENSYIPKSPAGLRRYADIQARFKALHDVERLRIDDAIQKIMEEFYIDYEATVWRILRTNLPSPSASN